MTEEFGHLEWHAGPGDWWEHAQLDRPTVRCSLPGCGRKTYLIVRQSGQDWKGHAECYSDVGMTAAAYAHLVKDLLDESIADRLTENLSAIAEREEAPLNLGPVEAGEARPTDPTTTSTPAGRAITTNN